MTGQSSDTKGQIFMKNANHGKKMIAPIVITVLFLAYLAVYITLVGRETHWHPAMVVLLFVPLAGLGLGMVYVLRERIREIQSGEEDDLDKH